VAKGLKSKKLTTTGVISTAGKPAILWGYNLVVGTTDSKVIFKNGGTGGTDTWNGTSVKGTAVGDVTKSEHFSKGVIFSTDLFGTLSGTGAYVYVIYEELE
jgi:hypothetical protein